MKGYGPETFGKLNADRYDELYEDLMLEETLLSLAVLKEQVRVIA